MIFFCELQFINHDEEYEMYMIMYRKHHTYLYPASNFDVQSQQVYIITRRCRKRVIIDRNAKLKIK